MATAGAVHPEARFEVALGEYSVWDLTRLLPSGRRRYPRRPVSHIKRIYVHKSGADGPAGWKGAMAMARYVTRARPKGRGWPGAPYQMWIPRVPDLDGDDRIVIYRTQRDDVRSYHTGGAANGHGVAVALQGRYDGEWDLIDHGMPRILREPTPAQMGGLEALVDYWCDLYRISPNEILEDGRFALSGHWEAPRPKKVCPGDAARLWVQNRRKSRQDETTEELIRPTWSPSVVELNAILASLGYEVGEAAQWDYQSRHALEAFQRDRGLEPDGWFGPKTAEVMDPLRARLLRS